MRPFLAMISLAAIMGLPGASLASPVDGYQDITILKPDGAMCRLWRDGKELDAPRNPGVSTRGIGIETVEVDIRSSHTNLTLTCSRDAWTETRVLKFGPVNSILSGAPCNSTTGENTCSGATIETANEYPPVVRLKWPGGPSNTPPPPHD